MVELNEHPRVQSLPVKSEKSLCSQWEQLANRQEIAGLYFLALITVEAGTKHPHNQIKRLLNPSPEQQLSNLSLATVTRTAGLLRFGFKYI